MNQQQTESLYRKKILPRRILGTFNALLSIAIIIFFFSVVINRTGSGKFVKNYHITVLPLPLNEMDAIKDKEKRQELWKNLFSKYSQKIQIDNNKDLYRIIMRLRRLPLNRPRYVEIALEVYNNEKDYLFTFYADNFWNQSGYDDGYWHEWNYTERVHVNFPYKGEYYLVAAVGRNRNYRAMFNAIRSHSNGKVQISLYKDVKPVSFSAFVISFMIFIGLSIWLFATRSGKISKYKLTHPNYHFKFDDYHYIAKLPGKISNKPFYVSGYSKRVNKSGVCEYILTQDNVNTYLEAEQEIEYDDDSRSTNYYFYYYKTLSESEFPEIPTQSQISYKGENYTKTRERADQAKEYLIKYSNGLTENIKKYVTNFGSVQDEKYISFEYIDDPKNFDVSWGYEIKTPKIWSVKKEEQDKGGEE